jgi:methylation protein EvaC
MKKCLICETPIEPFISLGRMPIANGFITADQFAEEPFFELPVAFCPECKMVQLTELVAPEMMFHENYAFFSSTSKAMAKHFENFAASVKSKYLGEDPFVVELGSNDGIMLQHFAKDEIRHLGVEPSKNVAEVASQKGILTVSKFFSREFAEEVRSSHGPADAVLGANVMCHIPTMHSVIGGVKLLLKPKGVLIFEDPYLGDIIEKTSYDQIYDEHAFYFSVTSLDYLFARYDMEIIDVAHQTTHGGSMRYTVAHRGAWPVAQAVLDQRAKEESLGLSSAETYTRFRKNVEKSRDDLMALLRRLRAEGKTIAGYAATSKSTTVTNYCGITPDLVEYISDTTPIKQNKFSPGVHIPVRPHSYFYANPPDYALLFGWNHANEIKAKEREFVERGGKWIVYVPRVEVQE